MPTKSVIIMRPEMARVSIFTGLDSAARFGCRGGATDDSFISEKVEWLWRKEEPADLSALSFGFAVDCCLRRRPVSLLSVVSAMVCRW